MDLIKRYFKLDESIDEPGIIECEARIKGFFVNMESIKNFLMVYSDKLVPIEYTEIRKRVSSNCSYRCRKIGTKVIKICKSVLFRDTEKDMWFTMNISSEIPIHSTDMFDDLEPVLISRWSMNINSCIIEIGVLDNMCWVEVEKIPKSTPELFFKTVYWIILELQKFNSPLKDILFTYYIDHCIINSVYDLHLTTVAKPITLTNSNLVNLLNYTHISPKYDGVRAFYIIRMGTVYYVDLRKNVLRVATIDKLDDILTILDCEIVDGIPYIIDVVIYNNKYVGDMPTDERLNIRGLYSKYIKIKPFYKFKSIDTVLEIYQNSDIPIDGIIFLGKKYTDVIKWKEINTIDLYVNSKGNLVTRDKKIINVNVIGEVMFNTIYEFQYTEEGLIPVRDRIDKPHPNPLSIVVANTKDAITKEFFTGTSSFFMRKYHNKIKKYLLNKTCPKHKENRILLDLGTGQGGDINKWNLYTKVYCVDPNPDTTKEYLSRYDEIKTTYDNIFLVDYVRDLDIIECDVVSAFFCMNLFTDKDFEKLFEILGNNVSYFIGICITEIIEENNKCYTLSKISQDTYSINIHETRIENIIEKVVDLSYLTKQMSLIGYNLVESGKLIPKYNALLSSNEKKLSSLYNFFIYKK